MASCEAHDAQLKAFSPQFLRTREARTDQVDPNACAAEEAGKKRCPEGFCRCSGVLRPKVETRDRPWGVHATEKKPCAPFKDEFDAAGARTRRDAFVKAMIPQLAAAVAAARVYQDALGIDEDERARELEEWLDLLRAKAAAP